VGGCRGIKVAPQTNEEGEITPGIANDFLKTTGYGRIYAKSSLL
jgi:hypothetical protein